MAWDEARCQFSLQWAEDSLVVLKAMLDPQNLHTGCRVIKHPDCCHLCVLNDDCWKLPVHVNCRCRPEMYLGTYDDFVARL